MSDAGVTGDLTVTLDMDWSQASRQHYTISLNLKPRGEKERSTTKKRVASRYWNRRQRNWIRLETCGKISSEPECLTDWLIGWLTFISRFLCMWYLLSLFGTGLYLCCCYMFMLVPSQVVLSRTLSKKQMLMSVATKIAIQLNVKMGGEVWALEVPVSFESLCVFCAASQSRPHRSRLSGIWAHLGAQLALKLCST